MNKIKNKNARLFIRQALMGPKYVGAIFPSSKELSSLMMNNASLDEARVIIELGPGTGVFTKDILNHKIKDSFYLGIEIGSDFIELLNKDFSDLLFKHGSAENIKEYLLEYGYKNCDLIISGLPWTAFNKENQESLLKEIYESLEVGGKFLTFSYFPLNHLPNGKAFKNLLLKYFKKVKQTNIVKNFPPAFIYVCEK